MLNHGKIVFDGDVDRAIGIYADCQQKMAYHYDFTNIKRPAMRSLKLEFLTMDVLNDPDRQIVVGDRVKLKLRCRANADFINMQLRFEINASDNTVAGTMFSKEYLSAKAGQILELDLELNTEYMVPGTYRFDLLAFERNDFGLQDWCDRVSSAPILELQKKDRADLEWLPQWWGHTKFKDVLITSIHTT